GYYGQDNLCRLIESLGAQTGDVVTLAAPHGAWLQIVDVVEPVGEAGLIRKGSRVPAMTSVVGRAFLAAQTDDEIARWINRTPDARRLDEATIQEVMGSVAAARKAGFASGVSNQGDMFSIAIALPKSTAAVQLVLGLAGPPKRTEDRRDQLVAMMRATIAAHLSPAHP
ncbi:MAG: hypothetical protein JWO33_988, partial [Caulobacteraceae bacterium]|nr:hypothetical protein [Caulobacteraceae bacterium]